MTWQDATQYTKINLEVLKLFDILKLTLAFRNEIHVLKKNLFISFESSNQNTELIFR